MMWTEITNDEDIQRLMNDFGGFHDSCIVSVNYVSGNFVDEKCAACFGEDHTLEMRVDSQFGKRLLMRFITVRKCVLTGFEENYFRDIYDATLEFRTDLLGKTRDDRLIVWADRACFNPLTYAERYPLNNGYDTTCIIADTLEYRFLEDKTV